MSACLFWGLEDECCVAACCCSPTQVGLPLSNAKSLVLLWHQLTECNNIIAQVDAPLQSKDCHSAEQCCIATFSCSTAQVVVQLGNMKELVLLAVSIDGMQQHHCSGWLLPPSCRVLPQCCCCTVEQCHIAACHQYCTGWCAAKWSKELMWNDVMAEVDYHPPAEWWLDSLIAFGDLLYSMACQINTWYFILSMVMYVSNGLKSLPLYCADNREFSIVTVFITIIL